MMNTPLSPDAYRSKLLQRILLAQSEEEVRRSIDEAMQALQTHRVHGHAILRFVEIIISEFESFDSTHTNSQQCNNIALSLALLESVRQRLVVNPS
jgi:hypothetical protein